MAGRLSGGVRKYFGRVVARMGARLVAAFTEETRGRRRNCRYEGIAGRGTNTTTRRSGRAILE
jgi:hypothetical protein